MNRNKLFFKKLLVFLLLASAMNFSFNAVYDHWMYYFRLARTQDKQFDAYHDTLRYLMLGNSHNRVNPEILGNGFGYIMPKEVYTQTYYKLKYILEKTGKKPENIFLSIDPVNFSPKAESELPFDGYWKKYLDYFDLAREYHDPRYLLYWFSGNFFSYVGNYKYAYMSLIFFNADLSKIKNGYIPARDYENFARLPNRETLGYEVAMAYLSSYSKTSQLGDTKYYLKLLALCRQYQIRLFLLRMPLTDEYLKYAGKMIDIGKLDCEIIELTRKHCNNFEVFDFRNEFRGKPEYFFNADHINPEGVAIVTKKIKSILDEKGKVKH
ncbi:MAG: hypothetical protein NTW31_02440 [Bacteroidetes bacterium]|nr:hypothetical protein [Bacteroidota bacterium]